jgi:phospholipid-binding lipoprotein MlaA
MVIRFTQLFLILFTLALSGCATTGDQKSAQATGDPRDPLESINRPFWTFTWDYADKYVMKPVTTAYVEYTPMFLRDGVYNMAKNLDEPSSAINNLLQGKFTDAAQTTGRFILNSTVGLFGFFDPATHIGLDKKEEEFGEVLGKYGVGDGPFLIIPVLGPSSVRDEVGDYVDKYYWPLAVIDFWPNILRATVKGLEARAKVAQQEKLINESLDPYEFVKNAYFQNMQFKVYDGHPPIEVNKKEEAELDSYLNELDSQ